MGRRPDPAIRVSILKEAERLIHLHGFHHTSLDQIAKSCRMTKANLLHHYGSKEELGLAVLEAKMSDYIKTRVDPLCGDADPVDCVMRMFAECAARLGSNGCKAGCFIGNIALEMSDLSEQFRKRVSRFFEEWTRRMAERLERAQTAGYFAPSLDPRAAAEAILSLYEGAIMLARTRRDASVFLRVGEMARSLLEVHKNRKPGGHRHGTENTLRVLNHKG